MADFWLDTDIFVRAHRQFYRFDIAPKFWEYLGQKAKEGIIASPIFVLAELEKGKPHKRKSENGELIIPPSATEI